MKKIIRDITLCILAVSLCFGSVACIEDPYPEYESGYFRYAVKTEKKGVKKAYIVGLTEIGLEQTALVYPEEIDGIPVYGIGYNRSVIPGYIEMGDLESERLQKFYFPHMPKETDKGGINFPNAYIVHWNLAEANTGNRPYGFHAGAIFGYNYVENDCWIYNYLPRFIGNVSYLYNYEGAPNQNYYWVDSYDQCVITFIPPEPQRDSYKFDGWYKESECVNEWNFLVDVTSKQIELEHNKDHNTYEGIYLYAKWIEN